MQNSPSSEPVYSATPPSQPVPTPKSSGYALASLILGILSLIGGVGLVIPPILAVVFGHMSVSQCNKNPALTGKGMGIAGLVMGYVSIVVLVPLVGLILAMAIPASQKVRQNSQDRAVLNNARMLAQAADQYYLENGASTVRIGDLVGTDKYVKSIVPVAGEKYPDRFTQGVTITIQGIAGTRTITYAP